MVNIEKTDVNDIALTVPSASTLRAKIVIAGTDPLSVFDKTSAARPQFRLIPTQPLQPSSGFILLATTDGTFEVRSAFEGKYRVSLGPLGENHYVSELRLDGVRAPNNMIEVQPNAVAELVLVVRPDGGRVEGMVVDDKNQPVAGVRGILLPDPVPDVIGSYYPISSNPDGNFTLRGVAPGNYRAFVWSGLGELQLFDRELWTRTRGSATAIRVDVGSRITANIKVITP